MIYETSIAENYHQCLLKNSVPVKLRYLYYNNDDVAGGSARMLEGGEVIKFKLICENT